MDFGGNNEGRIRGASMSAASGGGSRPGGITRRKSSNLLASLGRQNTFSEREKDRDAAMKEEAGGSNQYSAGIYSTPRGPSSYATSTSMAANPSSASTIVPGGSTTPTHVGSSNSNALRTDGPNAPTAQNTPSSQSSFGVALENLRYMLQKRIATFSYLKRAHEGRVHWFNTILLQREELDAVFTNAKMAKRCICLPENAIPSKKLTVLLSEPFASLCWACRCLFYSTSVPHMTFSEVFSVCSPSSTLLQTRISRLER